MKNIIFSLLVVVLTFSSTETFAQSPILDGTNVPSTNFPEVCEISTGCTGTLIATDLVLTAAHCIGRKRISVIFPNGIYASSRVSVHKTYNQRNVCEEGEFGAAVVKLVTPVVGVTPADLYTSAPIVGDALQLVGYGVEGTGAGGENGEYPAAGTVNTGNTTVEEVTPSYVKWIFDPGESNTGGGDSGGPAFIDVSGDRLVHSITCGGGGDAGFETESINTKISAISDWINSAINTTGIFSNMFVSRAFLINDGNDRDKFLFSAKIDLNKRFKFRGKQVVISSNDFQRAFALNRRGIARNSERSRVVISGKKNFSKRRLRNKNAKITINLRGNDLIAFLNSYNFFSLPEVDGTFFSVRDLSVQVGDFESSATVHLRYNSFDDFWE